MAHRSRAFAVTLSIALLPLGTLAAQGGRRSHPDFLPSAHCSDCHSAAESATALWGATGDDVSPYTLWRATMMANAFRDPYWQAQVSKEIAAAPEHASQLGALCITCHAPVPHHRAKLKGEVADSVHSLLNDEMARDGVTCTVCHQTAPGNFGQESSFGGNLQIQPAGIIWGPFEEPAEGPMIAQSGFRPVHGPHLRDPGLCASCHTLKTQHALPGSDFPEQTPYLEWRNSIYSAEGSKEARTCQQCHMPELSPTRIARNPGGFDFNIATREGARGHVFVGGNAFMLDLMRRNHKELGMQAPGALLRRAARATRQQLANRTAKISIRDVVVADGELRFGVRVTNETGHKLPSGYPARRAWIRVQVRAGDRAIFTSGNVDDRGEIQRLSAPLGEPHRAVIDDDSQVAIYELIGHDTQGAPTTYLTRMATRGKDNRLLPKGWRPDGDFAADTVPTGVGEDEDFLPGEDTVQYRVKLGAGQQRLSIVAWFLYQPVPPAWVEALRGTDTEEAKRFVRMYDEADKAPETLALDIEIVQ
ncbi:MAG: hypothetical protein AB7I19_15145 [Planctomycetota bacterium]